MANLKFSIWQKDFTDNGTNKSYSGHERLISNKYVILA
jgi:hypothetical protein